MEARARRALAGIAALALLVSCGEQSRVDPDAEISIQGAARDVDGTPLASRPVQLRSGVTDAEGGLAVLTVGLSCFGGGCSGESFDTTTGEDGSFRLTLTGRDTQSTLGEATSFLLSTSAAPPRDRSSGPAVSAEFKVQATSIVMPTLDLVDVRPALAGEGAAVRATWDGSAAPAPYTLRLLDRDGDAVWEAGTAEPTASVDGRVLEDVTGLAVVSTTRSDRIEGSELEVVASSSGAAFRGGFGPPPSRGAPCEVHGTASVEQLQGCRLTDGSFTAAGVPGSVCATPADASSTTACEPSARVRIRLPEPVPAQLVVVRGCTASCRVATVAEGEDAAVDAGPVSARFGTVVLDERRVAAVDVVTDDVASLGEVSVWPRPTSAEPLLVVQDPSALLGGDDGGDDGDADRLLPTGVAIGVLLLAVLLLGVAIGRRVRAS